MTPSKRILFSYTGEEIKNSQDQREINTREKHLLIECTLKTE
jgi:hypothetical protein